MAEAVLCDLAVGPVSALPALLRDFRIDPLPLFEAAGVAPEIFGCPDNRVRVGRLTSLLHLCVEATGLDHFAVLVGHRFEMHMLGALGYLIRNERTVHAALRRLVLDLRLDDRATVASFEDMGPRHVGVSYAVCAPNTPYMALADDVALMIGCRIMHQLCGPACRPAEIQLAHSAPRDRAAFQTLFRAPVRFDAPRSMMVFERRWLDQPVNGADPYLLTLLDDFLKAARAAPMRLSDHVRRLLSSGVRIPGFDAGSIADLLHMSERRLRRGLAEEGTSLHALTAEARLTIARQLLEETHLPIGEVAVALNYSDVTAFSRAFRSWTGSPPSAWREAHRPARAGAAALDRRPPQDLSP